MNPPEYAASARAPTPAENAMKQFSKTDAESGEVADAEPKTTTPSKQPVRPGDAGVGESTNQGSSPYQDRSRPEEAER